MFRLDDSILKGKRALVTGASQGLGKVIAQTLAEAGCHVLVNCSSTQTRADAAAEEIRAAGGSAEGVLCDISDEKQVRELFEKHSPIEILVNNARLDPWKRTEEMSDGEWWDRVLSVNLKGTYLCCQAFLQAHRARNASFGRIVNISSVRAFRPAEENMVAYGVSKLGMHGITRAFAQNGAPFGITANTVAPGMIVTENLKKRISAEKMAEETSAIPLGYGASCEQIADAVLFAVRNGYVTGETININGGMYYEP